MPRLIHCNVAGHERKAVDLLIQRDRAVAPPLAHQAQEPAMEDRRGPAGVVRQAEMLLEDARWRAEDHRVVGEGGG